MISLINDALYALLECKEVNALSKTKRYHSLTKALQKEKVKKSGNRELKNIDIELEDSMTARRVRRIVEKRTCQAYYNLNKTQASPSNKDRQSMRSAISYQLYNLGQIDDVENKKRNNHSHWKQAIDPETGKMVWKKKMTFHTLEEAQEAAQRWPEDHPYDKGVMQAYRCDYCHEFHIGHAISRPHRTIKRVS